MNKEAIKKIIHSRLDNIKSAYDDNEAKFYSNVVDPFSAILQAGFLDVNFEQWKELEAARQIQKTYQNAVGTLHQEILATFDGWQDLGTGSVVDVVNNDKKIIAEVKNKFNTTKGNHKTQIYRDIEGLLASKYAGYTGYYVEVIPKRPEPYDKPFTPSDNTVGNRLIANESIRIIDGHSFYRMASGEDDALEQVFKYMFEVILEKTGASITIEDFQPLFNKAYKSVT